MSEVKIIAASIVNFLKQQLEGGALNADSRESVEVGVQCIETAFDLGPDDFSNGIDFIQLLRQQQGRGDNPNRAEAEQLKNEGNELMKAERYREALAKYSRAIDLDPSNAVYFCNRAAANYKLGDHEATVADCTAAIAIQPNYSKAHGRMGLALTALDRHRESRAAYARAAQLEPDNESYKQNLQNVDERLAQRGERGPLDLGGLLQNPALINMATEMLSDPNMQNLISGLMNNTAAPQGNGAAGVGSAASAGGVGGGVGGVGNMSALLEAGQALAQHMQAANPDLVEQLRRQVRPPSGPGGNPPPAQ